jgi:hypothetical protein
MTDVTLHLPQSPVGPLTEALQADDLTGLAILRSHATYVPLAPHDIVRIDDERRIVDIEHLEPLWVFEVTMHLPKGLTFGQALDSGHPALRAVAEAKEEWSRAAWVTQKTTFSFIVSTGSREWFNDNVRCHPYVEHCEQTRDPEMHFSLEHALAHPNI